MGCPKKYILFPLIANNFGSRQTTSEVDEQLRKSTNNFGSRRTTLEVNQQLWKSDKYLNDFSVILAHPQQQFGFESRITGSMIVVPMHHDWPYSKNHRQALHNHHTKISLGTKTLS